MMMVKKLFYPGMTKEAGGLDDIDPNEEGGEESEEETVPSKWVPHNEREEFIRQYQENVKTAEMEKQIWDQAEEVPQMAALLYSLQNVVGSTTLGLKEESEDEDEDEDEDEGDDYG